MRESRSAREPLGVAVLEVHELCKRFGDRTALDGVSFAVEAGETYGLLGPNGAGKTTCIRIACGLLTADGGRVVIGGHDVSADPVAAKRAIGLVPQDVALYPDLSARENLRFFGRLQRLRGARLEQRVDRCLEIVGLSDRGDERIETYSGGMKRRANIAAGLLHEPELLVLDEPTVGVDPQSRNAILAAVAELGGSGLSVLYTTHYMEEAERLCDRVGIVDDGRLVAEGTQAELIALTGEQTRIRLHTSSPVGALLDRVRAVPGVLSVTATAGAVDVLVEDPSRTLAPLVSVGDGTIVGIDVDAADLEAVFLHLTGKALRD